MKIFIITMDDPLYTIPFIKGIINERKKDICGLALVTKGDRLSVQKKQSKFEYLIALIIILGPILYFENIFKVLSYRLRSKLSKIIPFISSPSILYSAEKNNIPTYVVSNPNEKEFLNTLKDIQPDVIINQSQSILKKDLLSIPRIGIINRHNALLPKNRGRLTPFWVKFKKEKQTGVSIHFVNEKIDEGDIIYQESFIVNPKDSIRKIVEKNYELAHKAMLIALNKLEARESSFIKNDSSKASYNTIPSLKDAIRYRLGKKFTSQ